MDKDSSRNEKETLTAQEALCLYLFRSYEYFALQKRENWARRPIRLSHVHANTRHVFPSSSRRVNEGVVLSVSRCYMNTSAVAIRSTVKEDPTSNIKYVCSAEKNEREDEFKYEISVQDGKEEVETVAVVTRLPLKMMTFLDYFKPINRGEHLDKFLCDSNDASKYSSYIPFRMETAGEILQFKDPKGKGWKIGRTWRTGGLDLLPYHLIFDSFLVDGYGMGSPDLALGDFCYILIRLSRIMDKEISVLRMFVRKYDEIMRCCEEVKEDEGKFDYKGGFNRLELEGRIQEEINGVSLQMCCDKITVCYSTFINFLGSKIQKKEERLAKSTKKSSRRMTKSIEMFKSLIEKIDEHKSESVKEKLGAFKTLLDPIKPQDEDRMRSFMREIYLSKNEDKQLKTEIDKRIASAVSSKGAGRSYPTEFLASKASVFHKKMPDRFEGCVWRMNSIFNIYLKMLASRLLFEETNFNFDPTRFAREIVSKTKVDMDNSKKRNILEKLFILKVYNVQGMSDGSVIVVDRITNEEILIEMINNKGMKLENVVWSDPNEEYIVCFFSENDFRGKPMIQKAPFLVCTTSKRCIRIMTDFYFYGDFLGISTDRNNLYVIMMEDEISLFHISIQKHVKNKVEFDLKEDTRPEIHFKVKNTMKMSELILHENQLFRSQLIEKIKKKPNLSYMANLHNTNSISVSGSLILYAPLKPESFERDYDIFGLDIQKRFAETAHLFCRPLGSHHTFSAPFKSSGRLYYMRIFSHPLAISLKQLRIAGNSKLEISPLLDLVQGMTPKPDIMSKIGNLLRGKLFSEYCWTFDHKKCKLYLTIVNNKNDDLTHGSHVIRSFKFNLNLLR